MSSLATEVDRASVVSFRHDPISSHAGLMPVSLSCLPIQSLRHIDVYLRADGNDPAAAAGDAFTLFCAGTILFDQDCRQRLLDHDVQFVYIPISQHDRFSKQTESEIENIVKDSALASAAKWAIVQETSTELANELLSQRSFSANLPRLQSVSKAVSSLVLNDPSAFSHLFATSHHDFYTATHMVNVGTGMVALAYAMGTTDEKTLCSIFQAGLLHDVGKLLVPKEILNKTGQLSEADWACLRRHPEMGCDYLQRAGVTDQVMLCVASQHHERMDGSGYPKQLCADEIHPISRMCAVVDSFDALTALRPFKARSMPVGEAMKVIFNDSPLRYDARVVQAWASLVKTVDPAIPAAADTVAETGQRRKSDRYSFNCPVLIRVKPDDGRFEDAESIDAVAHNISAGGMGLLVPLPIAPGQQVRLHVQPSRKVSARKTYDSMCVRCRAHDDGWYEIGVVFVKTV
jgi:HD-GYP domain-containing protein (c-di-GMP phosphodiesterase class II)